MAAFEFGNYPAAAPTRAHTPEHSHGQTELCGIRPAPPLLQEPILTMKIYDSCRSKECLAAPELGPARDSDGRVIHPPEGAHSVTIDDLTVERIVVMKKEPSPFRKGFWNLELQYVFTYMLKFYGAEGIELDEKHATNSFISRVSLFGSEANEVSLFTDLLGNHHTLQNSGVPNLLVEAKAIPLTADISRGHHHTRPHGENEHGEHHHCHRQKHVFATIGLFSIVKLYRLVSLMVESRGFVIPPPCEHVMPNPCDFFDTLHFPMDSFAPPQKKEFKEGKSLNIAPDKRTHVAEKPSCKC